MTALSDVIQALHTGRINNLVHQLGIQLDEHGRLRSHGRFEHSPVPLPTKTPVLLPRNEHYTRLLIQDTHERLLHAGISHTLSQVRQTYWIPQERAAVRKVFPTVRYADVIMGLHFAFPRRRLGRKNAPLDLLHSRLCDWIT